MVFKKLGKKYDKHNLALFVSVAGTINNLSLFVLFCSFMRSDFVMSTLQKSGIVQQFHFFPTIIIINDATIASVQTNESSMKPRNKMVWKIVKQCDSYCDYIIEEN